MTVELSCNNEVLAREGIDTQPGEITFSFATVVVTMRY